MRHSEDFKNRISNQHAGFGNGISQYFLNPHIQQHEYRCPGDLDVLCWKVGSMVSKWIISPSYGVYWGCNTFEEHNATQNLLRIEPGTGTVVEEEDIDEMIY